MPVKSQPRLTARPISRPSQPPPPPPIKAPKPEVSTKRAITDVRDASTDVADTEKVSDMLHKDENSRPPTSQKQNFPQLNQNSFTKLKGSGSPLTRKPAPPVPTKPAHLQRNCLTPPPKPGNLSSELGLSSYSLPEYEMSDLEHPQLSSTLMLQVLPRTHFLSKAQTEAAKPEPKPPQVPVRRESMKQINDMVLRETKRSSVVSTITSLEESFITRFRPVCDFPAPDVFTSCEKTYPSREQGSVAKSNQLVALSDEECAQASDHPPPPLPSTAPPTRSISHSYNEHISVIMPRQATPAMPPPPPLPVENISSPPVKSSGSIIPPAPPLPVTCPVNVYSAAKPVVQASTPVNQSKEQLMSCKGEVVDDSPISFSSIVKSGFADNLAKLYGATKRTENCCPEKPPPLAAKPRPYPVINKKPALVNSCGMKMGPPFLRMRHPHPAQTVPLSYTSFSLASPTPAISSPLRPSKTNTSPAPKPPRSAPSPSPPAPYRTSSLSTTPPPVHCGSSAQNLSRSLSVRSAPPPPVPVHSSDLDRSHSLRTSSTSSSPLPNMSDNKAAAATQPESITRRKYSFRAAPPPPHSLNPTESPSRESSSSRLGGPVQQSPKLLIC